MCILCIYMHTVCVYTVYKYTYMHMYIYIYVHIYIYIYVNICICIYIYTSICVCTYFYAFRCAGCLRLVYRECIKKIMTSSKEAELRGRWWERSPSGMMICSRPHAGASSHHAIRLARCWSGLAPGTPAGDANNPWRRLFDNRHGKIHSRPECHIFF